MSLETNASTNDEIDLVSIGQALWRSRKWLLGLAIGAGLVTFAVLSMMRPLYTSEARILIDNQQSAYQRPTNDQTQTTAPTLNEQAIQSQVQVLTSRDLAMRVVKKLDLVNNPQFEKDAGIGFITRFLKRLGIGFNSAKSEEEKAADAFADHLTVYVLAKSSVIAIDYTSGDPELAAKAANALAESYIDWQRKAKLAETKDATAWLGEQITALRTNVVKAESAVDQYRAKHGLYSGSNNVNLSTQQLSELNSQLILAKAQKAEAEARANVIEKMLAEKGDIDATPEVLQSRLISRLIEQRVQVQRQLAELSATLLPSHPRIQQLRSELKDVRAQIRNEAEKIVQGLQNQAQVASAREASLMANLNAAKNQASGDSTAEIRLQELQREAKADRDLLNSYLARYRDASAHHDIGAVPADATIVSNAYAPIKPSFPRRIPITALVVFATILLSVGYVVARELINATPLAAARPRTDKPSEPKPSPEAPVISEPRATKPASAKPTEARPAASGSKRTIGKLNGAPEPARPAFEEEPDMFKARLEETVKAVAQRGSDQATAKTPPSLRTDDAIIEPPGQRNAPAPSGKDSQAKPAEKTEPVLPWHRFRGKPDQTATAPSKPAAPTMDAVLTPENTAESPVKSGPAPEFSDTSTPQDSPPLSPQSDLERYLRRHMGEHGEEGTATAAPKTANLLRRPGPLLKNLDVVCDTLDKKLQGDWPRAVLIAPVSAVNALPEAITIARNVAGMNKRTVLLDIARGTSTVSDFMGMQRSPGFTELAAGRATFENVVHVDPDSSLQVIPAGDPNVLVDGNPLASFLRIFDALTQTYDCVIIHADRAHARSFVPALEGLLSAMVALFAPKTFEIDGESHLAEFATLDCPILLYERTHRARLTSTITNSRKLVAS